MTERILLVDDEPNVLHALTRQLRKRFDLRTAESGEAALRLLKTEGPFAVIVSDMRMPEMNGVELLATVKTLYPDTVRLMLTGNADQETAIEAVNSGQIFRFLTKPWNDEQIKEEIRGALRHWRELYGKNHDTDDTALARLVGAYDHDVSEHEFLLGYRWDIVLRGRDATPMEK